MSFVFIKNKAILYEYDKFAYASTIITTIKLEREARFKCCRSLEAEGHLTERRKNIKLQIRSVLRADHKRQVEFTQKKGVKGISK